MSDVDGLLKRLRKLDAEMTAGEWVHIEGQVKLRNDQPIASCWVQSGESLTFGPAQEVRDAAGIAKLRNAVREIISTIEQQRAELQTYKTASSYWYVKCLMDRGHKVDPHSSSQHDDQVIRDMAAERRENKEIIEQQRAEIERLRSQLSPRCSVPADIDLDVNGGDDADNPMGNQWDEWSELHDSD